MRKKIIIIGAGPAGLSVGYHFKKAGFNDFLILEKNPYPGGLSTSFKDKKGFIWDIGGHVIHNKNKEFVNFARKVLKNKLYCHKRKAFIYFKHRLIPYPFQNNIAFLPPRYRQKCLDGLIETQSAANNEAMKQLSNFQNWILSNFGSSIAKHFMIPQNQKSWQYPLAKMGSYWLKKRVSLPSIEKIQKECQKTKPEIINWGSHQEFFYPKKGGIGELWQKTADLLKPHIKFNSEVIKIDLSKRIILVKQGSSLSKNYDILVSTIPLVQLISRINTGSSSGRKVSNTPEKIKKLSSQLKHNSGLVIGLGFDKKPVNNNWHWMYFPEKKYPFFRLCHLSAFSKNNVSNPNYSSFIAEISWRNKKPDKASLINQITKQIGKMFFNDEKIKPISIFSLFVPYYYPIPTLNRNKILKEINSYLNKQNVYSFGRFGSWQYEKGNMDDCFNLALDMGQNL